MYCQPTVCGDVTSADWSLCGSKIMSGVDTRVKVTQLDKIIIHYLIIILKSVTKKTANRHHRAECVCVTVPFCEKGKGKTSFQISYASLEATNTNTPRQIVIHGSDKLQPSET